MSDLIDRQAALDAVDIGNLHRGIVDALQSIISEIPSAQPELIRCKDCKYCEHWYRDKGRCFLWCETGIDVFEDGFCNYAGKRSDG